MLEIGPRPQYLCRVTLPELLQFNSRGLLSPHTKHYSDVYGDTVPLAHRSEIGTIVDFLYKSGWSIHTNPEFLLLCIDAHKLHSLGWHMNVGTLKKYGEHFAEVSREAIRSAYLCEPRLSTTEVDYNHRPIHTFVIKKRVEL